MPDATDYQNISPQQYDQYIGLVTQLLNGSAGFERQKLQAQLQDATAARNNAYKIAQLQASTSRYGVDVQSRDEMRKLKENARQFDAVHELDMQRFGLEKQKFGLSYAEGLTNYLQTPDRYFEAGNFMNAAGAAANGQLVPQYGQGLGAPTPKTQADFAVLAGYPNPNATATEQPSAAAAAANGAYGGAYANGSTGASSGGGKTTDGRVQAMASILKALPPSSELGLNDRDYAVLQAVQNIATAPGELQAGTLKQWTPGNRDILTSGLKRLGYSAPDWWDQYQRMQPGQGDPGRA